MSKNISNRITWIKAILCVLVVYVHCQNTDWFDTASVPWIAKAESTIDTIFAKTAVSSFFFLSGYLFYRNYASDKLFDKWKSRLHTLFIPFVIWNLIYYFIELFLRNLPLTAGMFDGSVKPFNLREIMIVVFDCKYNIVFWFIQYLIIYILFTPIIWLFIRKRHLGFLFVVSIFVLGIIFSYQVLPYWMSYVLPRLQYMSAYLVGAYCSVHLRDRIEEENIGHIQMLAFAALGIIIIYIEVFWPSRISFAVIRLSFGIIVWFVLGKIKFPEAKRWMSFTFYIYAVHHLVAHFGNKMLSLITRNMFVGGIMWLVLPFFIIVFCYYTGEFIVRHFSRIASVLGICRESK